MDVAVGIVKDWMYEVAGKGGDMDVLYADMTGHEKECQRDVLTQLRELGAGMEATMPAYLSDRYAFASQTGHGF